MWKVNPHAGEVGIKLGKHEMPMRPSFEAVSAIEQKTGRSVMSLSREAVSELSLPLDLMATIVTFGIQAAGRYREEKSLMAVNREKIKKLIFETGLSECQEPIRQFLWMALTGGAEKKTVTSTFDLETEKMPESPIEPTLE